MVVLLHVSDIHCATSTLKRVVQGVSYDILVSSGDFECMDTAEAFLGFPGRLVAVTGNLDNPSIYRLLNDAGVALDGRVDTVMGLRFMGVGGLDVASNVSSIERSALGPIDVLVTHHPPRGILDRTLLGLHAGLGELKDLSNRVRPRMHLFGHIHESPGYTSLSGTLYVNPGPVLQGRYAVIILNGQDRVELHRIRI